MSCCYSELNVMIKKKIHVIYRHYLFFFFSPWDFATPGKSGYERLHKIVIVC